MSWPNTEVTAPDNRTCLLPLSHDQLLPCPSKKSIHTTKLRCLYIKWQATLWRTKVFGKNVLCQVWTLQRIPQGTHQGYHYYKWNYVNNPRATHPALDNLAYKNFFAALILTNISQNSVICFKGSEHTIKWLWRSGLSFSNKTSFPFKLAHSRNNWEISQLKGGGSNIFLDSSNKCHCSWKVKEKILESSLWFFQPVVASVSLSCRFPCTFFGI